MKIGYNMCVCVVCLCFFVCLSLSKKNKKQKNTSINVVIEEVYRLLPSTAAQGNSVLVTVYCNTKAKQYCIL
jgi:hypothetical protein